MLLPKKIFTLLNIAASWATFFLSFLFPRNRNIWIFVGWHKSKERETFADNSKYLFLHVAQTRKNIRAIWIGRDETIAQVLHQKGYESYNINSLKGI